MFKKPSLITRIAMGKLIGLIFGMIGFVALPYLAPESPALLRWGILLWYPTLGAVVGMFGVYTYHPILKLPMPWWFRSSLIGSWMNLVLTFFVYDKLDLVIKNVLVGTQLSISPFWFVAEGAIIGLVIGYFATKFGGEGPDVVKADNIK